MITKPKIKIVKCENVEVRASTSWKEESLMTKSMSEGKRFDKDFISYNQIEMCCLQTGKYLRFHIEVCQQISD